MTYLKLRSTQFAPLNCAKCLVVLAGYWTGIATMLCLAVGIAPAGVALLLQVTAGAISSDSASSPGPLQGEKFRGAQVPEVWKPIARKHQNFGVYHWLYHGFSLKVSYNWDISKSSMAMTTGSQEPVVTTGDPPGQASSKVGWHGQLPFQGAQLLSRKWLVSRECEKPNAINCHTLTIWG